MIQLALFSSHESSDEGATCGVPAHPSFVRNAERVQGSGRRIRPHWIAGEVYHPLEFSRGPWAPAGLHFWDPPWPVSLSDSLSNHGGGIARVVTQGLIRPRSASPLLYLDFEFRLGGEVYPPGERIGNTMEHWTSARQYHSVLLILCSVLLIAGCSALPNGGFIRVQGTRFVTEECEDFAFAGANVWGLMEAVAGGPPHGGLSGALHRHILLTAAIKYINIPQLPI